MIFRRINVTADLCFITLISKNLDMLADFFLRFRCTSKEVLKVQFDETVRGVGFKETTLIFGSISDRTHEFTRTQIAIAVTAFS